VRIVATGERPLTVINVFRVAREQQARLINLLSAATETSVRHAPGFLGAALHRGRDGTQVTMYAQWRTVEDYERMRRRPDSSPFLAEALSFASFEPGQYDVVAVFEPDVPDELRGRDDG
jgi:quinol monooxygenase YgiN